MNLIFEFIGIYLIMGIAADIIYVIVTIGYLFMKLYPNYDKLVEFNRHLESGKDTDQNKNKSNAIMHWLNVLFMWPYRITMAVYDVRSTIRKITT